MKLVLASNNAHKLTELSTLFAPLGIDLLPQSALGLSDADEPHPTFVENALAKARHAAHATGFAAIADDSGLCVDALGGSPGVMSARFATLFGHDKSDANNNKVLLEHLSQSTDRRAHFVSVLVALRAPEDPEPLITFGRWPGVVLREPRGQGGFGYDPLVFIEALGLSVAELGAEVKNKFSHRAAASRQMLSLMREVWGCG
ncbi:MAG: RdgB/HAM1 family non-canonical purine NTP pyrophosphatase [Burkholderiaceae bacterium]|nr:RdgB/HAM1 family non-canonical purine NTP pyrophosphatase [Burkholderiaceae bacterium]MDH3460997.1 RdgB/HAM1 family non-canonical purine NTP pyrophosphatase [Burkholderiaceae bacterium]